MRSAVLYAPGDAVLACELVQYLELNCPLTILREECEVGAGFDLIDGVERVIGEELTIVLLSPRSVPRRWARERWEPVLIDQPKQYGTRLAFVLAEECPYPSVLRSNNFYDLSRDRRAGQRLLKRWLLELGLPAGRIVEVPPQDATAVNAGDLEALRCRVCDVPGVEFGVSRDMALALAHRYKDDFEGVFWVRGAYRSRTAIIGEAGRRLGLNLAGTADQNIQHLRKFCHERRCLFIFEDVLPEDKIPFLCGGKTSAVFLSRRALPPLRSLDDTAGLFQRWAINLHQCRDSLGDAYGHISELPLCHDESLNVRLQLAKATVSMLRKLGCLAEAMDIVDLLRSTQNLSGDMNTQSWLVRERSQILNDWGDTSPAPPPVAMPEPVQLTFAFGAA